MTSWVYSHTPKWLSWLVIFADNDSSGLVRIRLRLGIHFSFCFSRLPTRQRINALSQIESSARLVRVDMGLKWPCIIFVTNKRKSSLTWLLPNILWKIGLKSGCKEFLLAYCYLLPSLLRNNKNVTVVIRLITAKIISSLCQLLPIHLTYWVILNCYLKEKQKIEKHHFVRLTSHC